MDSNEVNKLLAGFLGTCFVIFSVGIVSNSLFASPAPEKPGFAIVAAEPTEGGPAAPAAPSKPIAELLATANVEAGSAVFKKCQACHSGEKGGPNKVGPHLYGVYGRNEGSVEGFGYSAAMKARTDKTWEAEGLDHFLKSPKAYVQGTAMSFAGISNPNTRADVIAYLNTLSDSPKPLPKP